MKTVKLNIPCCNRCTTKKKRSQIPNVLNYEVSTCVKDDQERHFYQ